MIDRDTLSLYAEILNEPQRQALVAALTSTNRGGLEYKGPQIPAEVPYTLRSAGIPNIHPTQIVSGGYLTPLGKQLADILASGEADDMSLIISL